MLIQICVGSSCHLRGSEKIAELFTKAIEEHKLEPQVTLTGSFCIGKCNREGVTVTIDDKVFLGLTPEKFEDFFEKNVLAELV